MSSMQKKRSLFDVQRLMVLGLTALVLCTSLALTTGVASAKAISLKPATASPLCYSRGSSTLPPCDGENPIESNCDSNVSTLYPTTSQDLGGGLKETVALRYSSACGAIWADVYLNKPMPSLQWGNAIITRKGTTTQYDCGSSGGNGIIAPSQTSCYTAMLGDAGANYAWGAAMFQLGFSPWKEVARTPSY